MPADPAKDPAKEPEKGGKGKMMKFIMISVILLAQAAAAYFVVFNVLAGSPDEAQSQKNRKIKEIEGVGQFYEMKDIVVNPARSLGRRYLVLELGLEAAEVKTVEEAKIKEIWLRDAVLSLLTNKTSEELLDVATRHDLKGEILDTINAKMANEQFAKIYITKFIMQ